MTMTETPDAALPAQEAVAHESSRSAARKAQVLEAASECFRRHGFHGASMAQISKIAAMSVGHIYHYFENKEAIIAAIVEQDLLNLISMTERTRQTQSETGNKLLATMVAETGTCLQDCRADVNAPLMLEIAAEAARNEKVAEIVRKGDLAAMGHMRDFIREGLAEYGVSRSDAELDGPIALLAALFEGLTLRWIRNPELSLETCLPSLRGVVAYIIEQQIVGKPGS